MIRINLLPVREERRKASARQLALVEMAMDVLEHNDGVVHEDPRG